MRHTMSPNFYFCKWCGISLEEACNDDAQECTGTKGILHIKYLKRKKEAERIFQPIIDRCIR